LRPEDQALAPPTTIIVLMHRAGRAAFSRF